LKQFFGLHKLVKAFFGSSYPITKSVVSPPNTLLSKKSTVLISYNI